MMKILIDTCKEYSISPNALIILYQIVSEIPITVFTNSNEEFLTIKKELTDAHLCKETDELSATDKGMRVIADILDKQGSKEKKSKKAVEKELAENEIENFVDDYRTLFKGLKSGAMGDKKGCIDKFIQFKKDYPEFFSKKLILEATKLYIDSVDNYRFLTQADYFIYKHDVHKGKTSKLASFCEEVDVDKIGTSSFSKMV